MSFLQQSNICGSSMSLDQDVSREVTYLLFGYHSISNGYEIGQHSGAEVLKLKVKSPINIQLPTDFKI